MTNFRTPGMSASLHTHARRALVSVAVFGVVLVVGIIGYQMLPENTIRINMHTDVVAGGIRPGTTVMLNGTEIGTVGSITAEAADRDLVTLDIGKAYAGRGDVLTSAMEVTYAPKNLFGISAVVLSTRPGGTALRAGSDLFPETPSDATLTTLLHNLSDLDRKAFQPYMSDVLASVNTATLGLLPVIGTVSQLATDIADTQKLSTASTLPPLADLLGELPGALADVLPAVKKLTEWEGPARPGYVESQDAALGDLVDTTAPELGKVLGPDAIGTLMPLMPTVVAITRRVHQTFPDSRRNGLELATLIERVRNSLPQGPNGPVLTVDVALRGVPGISAALGLPGHAGGVR